MRLSTILKISPSNLPQDATSATTRATTSRMRDVIEKRNFICFFRLTIYFDDSIQRTNCDDSISQSSMKMERENRQHGNQEKGSKEARSEEGR